MNIYMISIVLLLVCILMTIIGLRIARIMKKQNTPRLDLSKVIVDSDKVVQNTKRAVSSVIRKECPSENKPPCAKGFVERPNAEGVLCCYTDPKSLELTDMEKAEEITRNLLTEVAVSIIADVVLEKIGNKIASSMVGKMSARLATKLSTKIAMGAVKAAPKIAAKLAIFSAKLGAMFAKMGMGPIGWALLAFDVLSLGLDLWDPAGYNSWVSNTIYENIRNQAEVSYAEQIENNGGKYPMLVSYLYDTSNMDKLMESLMGVKEITAFIADKSFDLITERYGVPESPGFTEPTDAQYEAILDEVIDEALELIEQGKFDKPICDTMRRKNFPVKWVKGVGCSLNKAGCDEFNRNNRPLPDDKRQFAMYTHEYRVRDRSNPGNNKKPNVVTRTLPEKVCMLSPLEQNYTACLEGKKGNQWVADAGMCSLGKSYCDRYELKRSKMGDPRIYNCKMYPGQKVAEIVLGTTITRSFMRVQRLHTDAAKLVADAHRRVLLKTYQAFDNVSEVIMEDVFMKSLKIAQKVGRIGANLALKMGREMVDITYNMVISPLKIAGELILEALKEGAKVVFGMAKLIAKGVFKHTKAFVRSIKHMGGDIFDGFEDIGKKIGGIF